MTLVHYRTGLNGGFRGSYGVVCGAAVCAHTSVVRPGEDCYTRDSAEVTCPACLRRMAAVTAACLNPERQVGAACGVALGWAALRLARCAFYRLGEEPTLAEDPDWKRHSIEIREAVYRAYKLALPADAVKLTCIKISDEDGVELGLCVTLGGEGHPGQSLGKQIILKRRVGGVVLRGLRR